MNGRIWRTAALACALLLLANALLVEAKSSGGRKLKHKKSGRRASSAGAEEADVVPMIEANLAEPLSPVHDVSRYVEWAQFVTHTASLLQLSETHTHTHTEASGAKSASSSSSSSLATEALTSASTAALSASALESAAEMIRGDPDAEDRDDKPALHKPDIVIHDPEWKGTTVGESRPHDWHPHLEGFRPPGGYFMQDPGCDRLMRIWLDTCSFADQKKSVYWKTPDKIFPDGDLDDEVTTGKYIGNLLKQDFESEPRSHSAKQNVGHYPDGKKFLVPDDGEPPEERFTTKPFLSKGAF